MLTINLNIIRHPIVIGSIYSLVWWAVAWSWRFDDFGLGVAAICAFGILIWFIQGSSSFGYRQLIIGGIGIFTDAIHSLLGIIPPMTLAEGMMIAGLWICFGQLMVYGVFGAISYRWAAALGGCGAIINYQGLASWMGHTPNYSLLWVGLEWMMLFPLFLFIKRIHDNQIE